MNKRGQGLSINAIILIILAVVVLVMLILGFTIGWGKILPFVSTNNVGTISTACQASCNLNNQYDFCTLKRDLKTEDTEVNDVTCNELATNTSYSVYGISPCQGLCP